MKEIKAFKAYFVNDHEDNKTYFFDTANAAQAWKKELIEEFDVQEENVSVLERSYDRFGNWLSQRYL